MMVMLLGGNNSPSSVTELHKKWTQQSAIQQKQQQKQKYSPSLNVSRNSISNAGSIEI